MNEPNTMILHGPEKLPAFQLTPSALALRDAALTKAALIGKVGNADENAAAVRAQVELKSIASSFEKARKKVKEPIIEAGRQIDRVIATELAEVEKELGRIQCLVSDFQLAEQRRIREEQEAQQRELDRIEADRVKALAQASTPAQVENIERNAAAAKLAEAKPVTAQRVAGQVVKEDWEIIVTNPYDLARYHPDCVKIEPLMLPIKAALNEGRVVKGVSAKKITKADVRARATIEV